MRLQSATLATAAGILFLLLAWLGSYMLWSSHVTAGARYRRLRADWQCSVYAPLAAAESRYFGYPVCLIYTDAGQTAWRTFF